MGDTLKPLFSWRGAICESGLGPATRHVALTLSLHMNERGGSAYPGPARLAKETGLHVSTVKEKLSELERTGWLCCVVRGGIKGEKRCANQYEATFPEPALFATPVAVGDPSGSGTRRPGRGDPSPQPRTPVAVGDPSSSKNSPKRANTRDEFETWWSGYPRKVDKAKAFALFKARRRDGVSLETLIVARDNYAAVAEPGFEKYPTTFLAGKDGPWSEHTNGIPAGARRNGVDLLGGAKAALKAMR